LSQENLSPAAIGARHTGFSWLIFFAKKILDGAFVTNSAQQPAHQGTLSVLLENALSVNIKISEVY
jgi:hypothetical protein